MSGSKKIMIIDDDVDILDSIKMLLEFEGYEVITASQPNTIFSLQKNLPDLLLLDIWLSGTDGRDICKMLKANADTRDMPIVLVSASREIEKSARESGADDYLSKPFDADELIDKIEKNLRLH